MFTKLISTKMHWSHLFEIDETSPVNIYHINRTETIHDPRASTGETFKWMIAWNRSLPRPTFFFENLSPSSTLSYTITKNPKRVNLQRKSHWVSRSYWGSPLIALSLDFTLIRVLFRFLIERILITVLSDSLLWVLRDRVFFFRVRSNRFFSSSMLFFRHVAIFYQIMLLLLLIKNRCFVFHSLKFSKIISLTCFDNFSKTDSEKNTKYNIENICHQFPDLYN